MNNLICEKIENLKSKEKEILQKLNYEMLSLQDKKDQYENLIKNDVRVFTNSPIKNEIEIPISAYDNLKIVNENIELQSQKIKGQEKKIKIIEGIEVSKKKFSSLNKNPQMNINPNLNLTEEQHDSNSIINNSNLVNIENLNKNFEKGEYSKSISGYKSHSKSNKIKKERNPDVAAAEKKNLNSKNNSGEKCIFKKQDFTSRKRRHSNKTQMNILEKNYLENQTKADLIPKIRQTNIDIFIGKG